MTALLVTWLVAQALTVVGVASYLRYLPTHRQVVDPGGVVVILSVRDDWTDDTGLLDALARQDARDFRLLIATSGSCPRACIAAREHSGWITTLSAGVADDEGQKVHKLRAALRALRPDDRYLLFLDTDILPPTRLIGRLLFPLVRDKADIVTGYRLQLPKAHPLLTLVAAAELQVATFPRMATATLPWAGAMAMKRETADRLELHEALRGRLSDDLTVGVAGWREKLRLRPVRDLLVATPMTGPARDALAFGVRQYRHVMTNIPSLWWIATLLVAAQAVGWVWALGWGGWPAIALGYIAGFSRALIRRRIISSVLEPAHAKIASRALWWDALAPFIISWTHLALQLAAATSHRIRWGGYDYWMNDGKVARMAAVQKPAGN